MHQDEELGAQVGDGFLPKKHDHSWQDSWNRKLQEVDANNGSKCVSRILLSSTYGSFTPKLNLL